MLPILRPILRPRQKPSGYETEQALYREKVRQEQPPFLKRVARAAASLAHNFVKHR